MADSFEKLDRIRREAERQRLFERIDKILEKASAVLEIPQEDLKEWLARKMKRQGEGEQQ